MEYTTAAAQAGQPLPVAAILALASVAGGVGGNLLASQIQTWYESAADGDAPTETDVLAWLQENAIVQDEVQTAVDKMLQTLEALPNAQAALPASDWQTFAQKLTAELNRMGNLPRFEATLVGSGVIVQGSDNEVVGMRGAKAGDVGGSIVTGSGTIVQGAGATAVVAETGLCLQKLHRDD